MKNVLIVIPSLSIGGAEKSLIEFLNAIDYKLFRIDLLFLHSKGALFDELNNNVQVLDIDQLGSELLNPVSKSLRYLIYSKKYKMAAERICASIANRVFKKSALHEWMLLKNGFTPVNREYDIAIAYLQGFSEYYVVDKVSAKKKILWMHTSFRAHSNANKLEKKYIYQFQKIVCVSNEAKNDFIDMFPEKKDQVTVFYNIVDRKKIKKLSEENTDIVFSDKHFNIVSVGRLHKAKGYDMSIEAFAKLNKIHDDTRFYIVGDGAERISLEKIIKNNSLQHSCFLLGSKKNPYPYMRAGDVILQASRYEGYCIVLAESKVLNKPIITTDFFGAREQIIDGVNGMIVKGNIESIYDGLRVLYEDRSYLEKFRNNQRIECNNSQRLSELLLE